jgi:D-alanyl-D-alanine carboxypeptidase (penicillin-binding protein 5/6)
MYHFAEQSRARATVRRFAALSAATAFTLPALLGSAALPSAASTVAAEDPPAPASGGPVGGPRMGEKGLIFNGGAPAPPQVSAVSYVVADADDGRVLAAFNPHGNFRPASTQKTLLALTMLPRLDPNGTYTATQDDANVEGTRVGMMPTQTYRIEDLWYGLLLRSGNDAANGLAKAGAGGDLAKGVRMMNAEAKRLQALDTTAVNPSGLDADGQFSSAYDLALMGRAGLQRGDFSRYVKTIKWTFPGNHTKTATKQTSKSFQVYTENRLLLRGYPGAIGVKMGYTTKAQNTMIAAAERDGEKIVVTLMGVPQGRITPDAGALLDWGIANAAKAQPIGTLVDPVSQAVTTAEDGTPLVGAAPAEQAGGTQNVASVGTDSSTDSSSGSSRGADDDATGIAGVPTVALGGGLAAAVLAGLVTLRVRAVRKRRRIERYLARTAQAKAGAQAGAAQGPGGVQGRPEAG